MQKLLLHCPALHQINPRSVPVFLLGQEVGQSWKLGPVSECLPHKNVLLFLSVDVSVNSFSEQNCITFSSLNAAVLLSFYALLTLTVLLKSMLPDVLFDLSWCVRVDEVHGKRWCGSGLCCLQRGSVLLPEQEKEPSDRTDVHRLVQQIPGESNNTSQRYRSMFRSSCRQKPCLCWQYLIELVCYFQVLCVNLLDAATQHITSAVRVHQQVKIYHPFPQQEPLIRKIPELQRKEEKKKKRN